MAKFITIRTLANGWLFDADGKQKVFTATQEIVDAVTAHLTKTENKPPDIAAAEAQPAVPANP